MASPDAQRVTESHRRAQIRLGAITAAALASIWPLLDPDDIDGTLSRWLTAAIPIVQSQRRTSAALAANYLTAFRSIELGVGGFVPVLAGPADVRAVTTSLIVTGPVSLKANLAGRVPRALAIAEERSAAAGMRHALNGGRETITSAVRADRRAHGYQRVTSGKACDFCSMLADRGAVYGEASATFQAHDRCSCTAEPVYR